MRRWCFVFELRYYGGIMLIRFRSSWWPLLKIVGVLLFIWLLLQIDRPLLWKQLQNIRWKWAFLSIVFLVLSDICKVLRWYYLLTTVQKKVTIFYAWQTFYVGLFLGMLTPAKLGEFGRLAYLNRSGIKLVSGTVVIALDRIFDLIVVGVLSGIAIGYLFGWFFLIIGVVAFLVFSPFFLMVIRRILQRFSHHEWSRILAKRKLLCWHLSLLTTLSWILYCLWPFTLMISLGVLPSVMPFFSAIILAGIIAMLPLAPSGLGTRDAALVWLLFPYGVVAEQTLALTFLMFISLVITSVPGVWYWIRGVSG